MLVDPPALWLVVILVDDTQLRPGRNHDDQQKNRQDGETGRCEHSLCSRRSEPEYG